MLLRRFVGQIMCFVCGLGFAVPAFSLDISVRGDKVFASGSLESTDQPRIEIALVQGKATELVLINVTGSDFSSALEIAALLERRKVKTTLSGYCLSACPVVFLGGRDRRFAEGEHPRRTILGLQPPLGASAALKPKFIQFLTSRLANGPQRAAFLAAVDGLTDPGGYVRVREVGRNTPQDAMAFVCATADTLLSGCQTLEGSTAASLGLVASPVTASNVLPPDLLPVASLFGVEMRTPTPEFEASLLNQGQAMCAGDATCSDRFKAAIPRLQAQKIHRSTALGRVRKGFGFSDNQETLDAAAKRAVYLCNHTPNNKKLCSVASVDDFDVSVIYTQNVLQTQKARSELGKPLTSEVWAGEEASAVPDAVAEFRTQQTNAPTPVKVAGLMSWRTGALAAALAADKVVVIDVHGAAGEMLPGAVHFWEGGAAFENAALDKEFDQRFVDMLALAAPEKTAAVVFYCRDSDCWNSINAALRAQRAGYSQVGWYRGGLRSWKAAGLPLVQKVPSVVVN